jgi:lycopene cyclase domain-containing protein
VIPARFEYVFVLVIFTLTGLSLTWDGVVRALKQRSAQQAISLFVLYCLTIEIVALTRGWWVFNERRVIGLYVWRIPLEELLLFAAFSVVVIGAWETLAHERN